jgi:uncharacterized protein involved in exopolysaccharide biosynthesis
VDLRTIVAAIKRRAWLVAVVVMVTVIALVVNRFVEAPTFVSSVKVQFTAPPQQDVSLFDTYRSSNARDETAIARNNFAELVQSSEVGARTARVLGLRGADAAYDVKAALGRESDFLTISVEAGTPEAAARIVNTHVDEGIKYYGEVRAKPSLAVQNALAEQVKAAGENAQRAEAALTDFQRQNGIGDLDNELEIYQNTIQELRVERTRRTAAANTPATLRDVEGTLEQMTRDRDRLLQLVPAHSALKEDVRKARADLALLQEKYTEATLKADTVLSTSFIQVVEPASAAGARAQTMSWMLMLLAVVGSLGFGALLALLLETLARGRVSPWETSANRSLGATGEMLSEAARRAAKAGTGRFSWASRPTDARARR